MSFGKLAWGANYSYCDDAVCHGNARIAVDS